VECGPSRLRLSRWRLEIRLTPSKAKCPSLLPFFGLAAFTLVLPMTLLVLFGVMLVVLSYRQVVAVYTGQAARTW